MSPFDLDDLKLQHEQLRRIARAIVGDSAADDVVQDAWAAALARRDRAPGHWGRWMNRVTHNLAWKRRLGDERGAARERERASEGPREAASPEDVVAEIEAKHVVERAILELDEPYRSVLLWRYYEGLSIEEVSRRAGTIPSTTRTHLQRGLDRLRARLRSERGPEWRLALLPFLRPEPAAAKATVGAVLVGAWTMTWMKWTVAAVTAVTLGVLWATFPGDTLPLREVTDTRTAGEALAPPPEVDADEASASIEPVEARDMAAIEAPIAAPVAVDEGPSATLEFVEATSGLPLDDVRVTVHHAVMERRLFMASTKRVESEAVTDEAGRADVPVELDEDGQSPGGAVYATIAVDARGVADVSCASAGVQADGSLRLAASTAAAFRVQLPEDLSDADAAALSIAVCIDRPGAGRESLGARLVPARVRGRELLVLVPDLFGPLDPLPGVVKIATSPAGPSFEAAFERVPGLGDAPLEAVRSTDVTHTFHVTDASTGAPVEGAYVSIARAAGSRSGFGERVAAGATDAQGEVELIGVPSATAQVSVFVDGYENQRADVSIDAGVRTEIRLEPLRDVREVALEIRGTEGDPPMHIWCRVTGEDGGHAETASLAVQETDGGWVAEATLEHVPLALAYLEIDFAPASHDPVGPLRIEPGADELEVEVGAPPPLVHVLLDLPDDADATYHQGARGRKLARHRGKHSGLTFVTTAPDDGRPVVWIVDAPSYVPAHGTEADWERTTHEGRECVKVAPELQRGWGSLIEVISRDDDASLPFAFRAESPIAGATIVDPTTGATLGVTDTNGMAVVTADRPLERIEVRYGGKSKTLRIEGARRTKFSL